MKKIVYVLAMVLFIGFSASETFAQKKGNKAVYFKSDMDCTQCEKTVYEYMKFEKGVKNLKVDHASNTIMVEYKEGKNTDEKLAQVIEKKGYKADKISKGKYDEILAELAEHGHEHQHEQHVERK